MFDIAGMVAGERQGMAVPEQQIERPEIAGLRLQRPQSKPETGVTIPGQGNQAHAWIVARDRTGGADEEAPPLRLEYS